MKYKIVVVHEDKSGKKIDICDKQFKEALKSRIYEVIKENLN